MCNNKDIGNKDVDENLSVGSSKRRLTSFSPVISRSALAKYKVIWAEKAPKRTRSHSVHRSWLEIDQDSARNVLVGTDLIVVHRDTFELEIALARVHTITAYTMLVRYYLPKFGS